MKDPTVRLETISIIIPSKTIGDGPWALRFLDSVRYPKDKIGVILVSGRKINGDGSAFTPEPTNIRDVLSLFEPNVMKTRDAKNSID